MPPAPAPRAPGTYRVALVCLGNICRSPMADVVLQERLADLGLAEQVRVRSAGTGGWHVGRPMDDRAAATLRHHGYDPDRHRAQQADAAWLDDDLVLAMDETNLADLRELAAGPGVPDPARLRLFRDFDPVEPGVAVADPYYGGDDGFGEVLAVVERTSAVLAAAIGRALGSAPEHPGQP
nr:low molecular weight protein-tyrosine-phosphatase [Nocardioides perillae]